MCKILSRKQVMEKDFELLENLTKLKIVDILESKFNTQVSVITEKNNKESIRLLNKDLAQKKQIKRIDLEYLKEIQKVELLYLVRLFNNLASMKYYRIEFENVDNTLERIL